MQEKILFLARQPFPQAVFRGNRLHLQALMRVWKVYFARVLILIKGFLGGSVVKNPPAMQETQVQSLGQEDPLEEGPGKPLQYSCLQNPMDKPGGLQPIRSQRVGHDWSNLAHRHASFSELKFQVPFDWYRVWQPSKIRLILNFLGSKSLRFLLLQVRHPFYPCAFWLLFGFGFLNASSEYL